jgi:hypothetical protein
MWRLSVAAAATLLLVLASITPASAQADLAEMDDEALAAVESYFLELQAMQRPLVEYMESYPGLDMADADFLAGFAPIVEEAAERVRTMVPPDCLVPVHEQGLLETQHRLGLLAAIQEGDLNAAFEHLQLAKDAENASLEALDIAICKDARPPSELEQGLPTMSYDEYKSDYTIAQTVFGMMVTENLNQYNAAKNRKQRVKALENLWGTAEYHLGYLTGINPDACFADNHTEQVDALREVSKLVWPKIEAAMFGNEGAAARIGKQATDHLSKAMGAFNPYACESDEPTSMSPDEWVEWVNEPP